MERALLRNTRGKPSCVKVCKFKVLQVTENKYIFVVHCFHAGMKHWANSSTPLLLQAHDTSGTTRSLYLFQRDGRRTTHTGTARLQSQPRRFLLLTSKVVYWNTRVTQLVTPGTRKPVQWFLLPAPLHHPILLPKKSNQKPRAQQNSPLTPLPSSLLPVPEEDGKQTLSPYHTQLFPRSTQNLLRKKSCKASDWFH